MEKCPFCSGTMKSITRRSSVLRGDRRATASTYALRCPTDCPDAIGNPFSIVPPEMALSNDARLQAAWERRFHEPLPHQRPPGRRRKINKRTELLGVSLTVAEMTVLDNRRGDVSRAEYTRRMLDLD